MLCTLGGAVRQCAKDTSVVSGVGGNHGPIILTNGVRQSLLKSLAGETWYNEKRTVVAQFLKVITPREKENKMKDKNPLIAQQEVQEWSSRKAADKTNADSRDRSWAP